MDEIKCSTAEVSYSWQGAEGFSGKVTVPVEVTGKQEDQENSMKVVSTNGYKLLDPKVTGANVSYELKKADGSSLQADKTEQDLGTLSKTTTKLDSKAKVIGDATETGNYTDTLNYHFVEK